MKHDWESCNRLRGVENCDNWATNAAVKVASEINKIFIVNYLVFIFLYISISADIAGVLPFVQHWYCCSLVIGTALILLQSCHWYSADIAGPAVGTVLKLPVLPLVQCWYCRSPAVGTALILPESCHWYIADITAVLSLVQRWYCRSPSIATVLILLVFSSLQFYHCCCSVIATVLSLLQCCHCCSAVIAVVLSLLQCCHCCSAAIAVVLSLLQRYANTRPDLVNRLASRLVVVSGVSLP